MSNAEWLPSPVCKNKTRTKIRRDAVCVRSTRNERCKSCSWKGRRVKDYARRRRGLRSRPRQAEKTRMSVSFFAAGDRTTSPRTKKTVHRTVFLRPAGRRPVQVRPLRKIPPIPHGIGGILCELNTIDQSMKFKNQNANQRSVCILERRSDEAGER